MVLIEAMACGTPVIAWGRGAVSEIVEDGVTGFIVPGDSAAAAAVERLSAIDRRAVRRHFERRFTARAMAESYVALYRRNLERSYRLPAVGSELVDASWSGHGVAHPPHQNQEALIAYAARRSDYDARGYEQSSRLSPEISGAVDRGSGT